MRALGGIRKRQGWFRLVFTLFWLASGFDLSPAEQWQG